MTSTNYNPAQSFPLLVSASRRTQQPNLITISLQRKTFHFQTRRCPFPGSVKKNKLLAFQAGAGPLTARRVINFVLHRTWHVSFLGLSQFWKIFFCSFANFSDKYCIAMPCSSITSFQYLDWDDLYTQVRLKISFITIQSCSCSNIRC